MSWRNLESIHDFLKVDKQLHYGGLQWNWSKYLRESELTDLKWMNDLLESVAVGLNVDYRLLMVGSAVIGIHNDVDILCCSYPAVKRSEYAYACISKIESDMGTHTLEKRTGGRSGILVPFSAAIISMSGSFLDLKFAGERSGEWQDVLDFHARMDLAHAIIA
jgi:hypothetical protein